MRLLTRSDFDGLICAVLLKEVGVMDGWTFVHPKDLQDGKADVGENDILANVPYVPGCGLWFDHHTSELERLGSDIAFKGLSKPLPSCARVVWEYYGGHDAFPRHYDEMLHFVDKCDSGNLSREEVDNPDGWVLLSFIADPRTGLGRYKDYRISNYMLMMQLVEWCRKLSIEQILEQGDIRERLTRYFEQDGNFRRMVNDHARAEGNVVILDLREPEQIFTGNRFTIYTMFPEQNVSIYVMWGKDRQNTVFSVGHSIFNRTCVSDIGKLMLEYGGGGHPQVGTCQVPHDQADRVLAELTERLRERC